MRAVSWVLRLLIAALLIMATTSLSRQAFDQLRAELGIQAALISTGVDRIQGAYQSSLIKPYKYEYVRVLADGYTKGRYKAQALEKALLQIRLRPSWPFAWFDLARWHARYRELDSPRFTAALRASSLLGKNEDSLRKARARMALMLLDKSIHPESEILLENALRREYEARPHFIYGYSALHGREALVCTQLKEYEEVGKWCGQMKYYRQVCAKELAKTKKHRDWCSNMLKMWKSWL